MKKILLSLTLACFGFMVSSNAQTIMSQNFNTTTPPAMPTGWTMTTTGGGLGWQTTNSSTNWYYAIVPAQTGTYAVVDDYSNPGNAPAIMTSPTFSLTGSPYPYVSYDYFFIGGYTMGVDTAEKCYLQVFSGGSWITIDSVGSPYGAWSTRYVSLASYMTATQLRFEYSDFGASLFGVAIDNINLFNAQANDISLTSVTPISGDPGGDFVNSGSAATFGGIVRNLSPNTMTSFVASYSVAGGTPVNTTITTSLAPMATYTFSCTPYTDAVLGNQAVQMWVTETGDPVLSNDSGNTAINAVSFMPTTRVTFEEGTGMWCGYCVRGIVYMDSLWKNDSPGVSIIAAHDQLNGTDALAGENSTTIDYDKFVSGFPGFPGYPGILVNRRYIGDPSDAFTYYGGMSGYFGFADLTLNLTSTGNNIIAAATVKPAMPLNGDYRLAMVVEESNVHSNSYYQHNYYSYTDLNEALAGVGYNFQDSVFSIPGSSMYFQFVARYSIPDFYSTPVGVAGSLPATMTAGTVYPYTFSTVSIPSDWDTANLSVVVMLIDNNVGSNTYQQVVNSITVRKHVHTTGVASIGSGIEKLNVFPNPATDQAHITFNLSQAGSVKFQVYDALGRPAFNVPAEDMVAGGQQINFSTNSLASGVYNVVITTDNGSESQTLSVVR